MRALVALAVVAALGAAGCSGHSSGSSPGSAIAITLTPLAGQSVFQGSSLNITAQVFNDPSEAGVSWALAGDGVLLNPTPSTVTYVAPATSIGNPYVVVTAISTSNSSSQSYIPITLLPQASLTNIQSINVDGGPVSGAFQPNTAFTAVTVCLPGTTTCQTIAGIRVETGSTGLRILSTALPSLPTINDGSDNPISECVQFPDQSYLWGDVVLGDVRIAGEVARALPIHALSSQSTAPSDCASSGAGANLGSQAALGANGILGIGYEPQDCGSFCDPSAGGSPPSPAYYSCSGMTCSSSFVPIAQQITNPIVTFAKDNNGSLIQFPGLNGAVSTIDGQITFGIGTQGNNQVGSATVFTVNPGGAFTTNLPSTGQSLTSSVVDSGLNAFLFPDDSLPSCQASTPYFCPAGPTALASVQLGVNNAQGTVNFTVDNAENLFTQNPGALALPSLGGPNGTGSCSGGTGACQFGWGLPFFYGRIVFTAIDKAPAAPGAPLGPWFAYGTSITKN